MALHHSYIITCDIVGKWQAIQLTSHSTVDTLIYLAQLKVVELRTSSILEILRIEYLIFQNRISKYL